MNAKMLTVAVLAFMVLAASPALAVNGCSTALLSGNYAVQLSGTAVPTVAAAVGGVPVPAGIAQAGGTAAANAGSSRVPADGIVQLLMDGNGGLYGNSSVSLYGTWLQGNISGQYTVNDDCSTAFTLTDSSGLTENFAGVIVARGDAVLILQADAGTGVSGVFRRMRGTCQTADLQGAFAIQYSGTTVANGNPYSSVGIVTLDGQGGATAAESRFSGGTVSQILSAGTITINPDCSAVLTLTSSSPSPQSLTFNGTLSVDEKQLFFVQSDAGTAATGSLIMQ